MWHSCGRFRLLDHFRNKDPQLLKVFRAYRAMVRKLGPVTVYAQKSRIVFQARARFTGFIVKKHWLEGAVWFKRRLEHPRFHRILAIPPRDYVHYFKLRQTEDIDREVRAWAREAYAIGRQVVG